MTQSSISELLTKHPDIISVIAKNKNIGDVLGYQLQETTDEGEFMEFRFHMLGQYQQVGLALLSTPTR